MRNLEQPWEQAEFLLEVSQTMMHYYLLWEPVVRARGIILHQSSWWLDERSGEVGGR